MSGLPLGIFVLSLVVAKMNHIITVTIPEKNEKYDIVGNWHVFELRKKRTQVVWFVIHILRLSIRTVFITLSQNVIDIKKCYIEREWNKYLRTHFRNRYVTHKYGQIGRAFKFAVFYFMLNRNAMTCLSSGSANLKLVVYSSVKSMFLNNQGL